MVSDPAKATDLAARLVRDARGDLSRANKVYNLEGVASSTTGQSPITDELLAGVLKENASKLADAVRPNEGESVDGLRTVVKLWSQSDFTELESWAREQSDPAVLQTAGSEVVENLVDRKRFPEASEWSFLLHLNDPEDLSHFRRTYVNWLRNDREAAIEWRKASELPAQVAEEFTQFEEQ